MRKIIGIAGIKRKNQDTYESVFIYDGEAYRFKGCKLEFIVWTEKPSKDIWEILVPALRKNGYMNEI